MTSPSSATKAGLVMRVIVPPRTASISLCGVPLQSRPDSRTLVSMTARTPPTLGPDRLHLCVDLIHRHRRDAGFGHAIGDGEQRIRCLPAPDRIGEQLIEHRGVSSPASRAALAVASGSSIWIFVMTPPSACLGTGPGAGARAHEGLSWPSPSPRV